MFLMTGVKICQQQIWGPRNCHNAQHSFPQSWYASIQTTSIVQFQLKIWVYDEVKRTVIKFWICWKVGWVQSEHMLSAVTSRQNIVSGTRLMLVTVEWLPVLTGVWLCSLHNHTHVQLDWFNLPDPN